MKYVIMSDGKMNRWKEKHNIPKHLMKIKGETLLQRIVRQVKNNDKDAEIIITSHNKKYDIDGAIRYEPLDNKIEIDRFTYELIDDNCCFLYGDTYYTDSCIKKIMNTVTNELIFYGNNVSIIALVVKDKLLMKRCIDQVKKDYLNGKLEECTGWQLYYQYLKIKRIKDSNENYFVKVNDGTQGFNTYEEYENFIREELS